MFNVYEQGGRWRQVGKEATMVIGVKVFSSRMRRTDVMRMTRGWGRFFEVRSNNRAGYYFVDVVL